MTKNEIFKHCLEEKSIKRTQNILESKVKINNLYKNEEILKLANLLGELKLEKVKKEIENKNFDDILIKINETKIKLATILKQNGVDIKNLTTKFDCEKCRDKGIIQNTNGVDILCDCLKEEYYKELLAFSETDYKFIPNLKEINTNVYSNKEEIDKLIKILQNNIETQKFNTILLSGETGTGKTFLSKSYLKTYILTDKLGLFIPSFNLGNELRKYHIDFDENKSLDRYLEPDLLVVEDLGTENMYNNITNEYLLVILNERQEANKLTLFTTNLTLNDIKERYTERFLSRLLDKNASLKYNFKGKDIRLI